MSSQDRAPAFQFYPKDWLSDPKVSSLSWADQGKYLHLLCRMWEYSDEGCWIPRKTAEKILGEAFIKEVADPPDPILHSLDRDGHVWLFSNRLSQEAQKCASRRAKAQYARACRSGT